MDKDIIRILNVLPQLTWCGGIESYLLSYYAYIAHDKFQFDFIVHGKIDNQIKCYIENNGGRVYVFKSFSVRKLLNLKRDIESFFVKYAEEYKIIHCHMANAAFIYFPLAKKYGINNCLLHSHNNKSAAILTHAIRNYPLLWLGRKYATHCVACTEEAGKFLFKNREFTIIKNAIDVDKFKYNSALRQELRQKLNVKDKFVVGHVGRLDPPKNQIFLLQIFAELKKYKKDVVLFLIGEGSDKDKLQKKVQELNLINDVCFLGVKKDVETYYQVFDFFVFPSEYEGLGIVLIEAQTSGLPVLASADVIPKDAKVSDLLTFMSLSSNAKEWAKKILYISNRFNNKNRKSPINDVIKKGYSIKKEAIKLENYYADILRCNDD